MSTRKSEPVLLPVDKLCELDVKNKTIQKVFYLSIPNKAFNDLTCPNLSSIITQHFIGHIHLPHTNLHIHLMVIYL